MEIPYSKNVFINCPFDPSYKKFFEAIVFSVFDCGFQARCSLEVDDGGQIRIEKIFGIIAECKFGIHDISKTITNRYEIFRNELPKMCDKLQMSESELTFADYAWLISEWQKT